MSNVYRTVSGDAWDFIAYKAMGSESYMLDMMLANPEHADVLVFDSGVELTVPKLSEYSDSSLPFWHDGDAVPWAKEAV